MEGAGTGLKDPAQLFQRRLWGLLLGAKKGETPFPASAACRPGVLQSKQNAKQGIFSLWSLLRHQPAASLSW